MPGFPSGTGMGWTIMGYALKTIQQFNNLTPQAVHY
jgi:hypothetical protein